MKNSGGNHMTNSTFKIIDSQFEKPVIRKFKSFGVHYAYWKSEGKIDLSFEQENYQLDVVAILDNTLFFQDDPRLKNFKGPDSIYFEEPDWILISPFEEVTFHNLPSDISLIEEEVVNAIRVQTLPILREFESFIQQEENAYPIPLIENVSVNTGIGGMHVFSFNLKGKRKRYTCSIAFDEESPNHFEWRDDGIRYNNQEVSFSPITYRLHILEQCFEIVKRFDKYRLPMKFSTHHHSASFPLFKPGNYAIDFSKVNYQYK
jgi:hypothetical protein